MKIRFHNENRAQRHSRQMAENRQQRASLMNRRGFEEIRNQSLEKVTLFPRQPSAYEMFARAGQLPSADTVPNALEIATFRFHPATDQTKPTNDADKSTAGNSDPAQSSIRSIDLSCDIADCTDDRDESSAKAESSTRSSTTTFQGSAAAFVPCASLGDNSEENSPFSRHQYAMVLTPEKRVFKPWTWFCKPTLVPISNYDVAAMTNLQRAIVVCDRHVTRRQPKYRKDYIEYRLRAPRLVRLPSGESLTLATNGDYDSYCAGDSVASNDKQMDFKNFLSAAGIRSVARIEGDGSTSEEDSKMIEDEGFPTSIEEGRLSWSTASRQLVLMARNKVLHTFVFRARKATVMSRIWKKLERKRERVDRLPGDGNDEKFSMREFRLLADLNLECAARILLPPQKAEEWLAKAEALIKKLSK